MVSPCRHFATVSTIQFEYYVGAIPRLEVWIKSETSTQLFNPNEIVPVA